MTEKRRPAGGTALRLVPPLAEAEPPTGYTEPASIHSRRASEAATVVLDQAKFASLARLDDGDGFLAQLVDEFLADGAGIVARIGRAAAAGDARAFRDEAHALRSSAAYLGATALFELCLAWRNIDDDALIMRGAAEVARLEHEFGRLRVALLAARAGDGKEGGRGGAARSAVAS